MEEKDYKIECKPTYWDVMLTRGEYSDYEEQHLYIAGNSQEEVWGFLCRFLDSIWNQESPWNTIGCINMTDMEGNILKRFATSGYIKQNGLDEDYSWGNMPHWDIWNADISRLEVIYFNK